MIEQLTTPKTKWCELRPTTCTCVNSNNCPNVNKPKK